MYTYNRDCNIDSRARICNFIGYGDGIEGYRLWYTHKHSVIISKHVMFHESTL